MNPTMQGQLLRFAGDLADVQTADLVLEAALPVLLDLAEANALLVLTQTADGLRVGAQVGVALEAVPELHHPDRAEGEPFLAECAVPATWRAAGITRLGCHRLPGAAGTLVLAWGGTEPDAATLELALATLDATVLRAQSQERLADLAARVNSAQQLANMGDYDWHIASDTNTWSDQLFRIYGHEPQSFQPSYEKFISLIHPEDRDRIAALHQDAYATGEPYQMIERVVRPDGTVRFLSSNGEVIMDEHGQPVRMRGTCIDITERVLADRERERITARFQGLVGSSPDAILLLAQDQRILEANQRAHELLGGDPQGITIEEILPGWPANGSSGVAATTLDGSQLQLDVITTGVESAYDGGGGEDALVALFLRDAAPRLEGEAVAARLGEAQLRRRQALEINDNVVQGLVAAVYALDVGEAGASLSYLERTLTSARAMMDDLLDPLDGIELQPGDLVRTAPADIGHRAEESDEVQEQQQESRRSHSVLIVDDAEDLRMLLRARMESYAGLTVAGEAADGITAVEMATELQPDLVLLDLAMPRMDGLEALPLIRAAVPGVRVIVLSGFNQSTLAQKALEAGADHYVVKGGSMSRLLELVDSLFEPA